MRLRKLSGVAAGALTAGVLATVPLAGPAAAEEAPAGTTAMWCSYSSYGTTYHAAVDVAVDGTEVTADLNDIPPFGMPAFVTIKKISAELDLVVGEEAVTLTGEDK